MQKSKIVFVATLTALVVGVVNSLGAVIAYSLVVPEPSDTNQTLIAANSGSAVVSALPEPSQVATATNSNEAQASVPVTNTSPQKLQPGKAPSPTGVIAAPSGKQVYRWCSGTNPNLPDEVCQAIVSIVSNPVQSNPHLGPKARQSLSLLPKDTSLTMDETSWRADGADKGTMIVTADTAAYGSVKIKISLEKQNNIWVLVDGQLS
jgi:hypothetical protein